jgi:hypothetical protein
MRLGLKRALIIREQTRRNKETKENKTKKNETNNNYCFAGWQCESKIVLITTQLRKMAKLLMFSSAIFIIFVGTLISSSQQKSLNQRDILVELFKSTNGDGWSNNAGWLSTSSECEWFGVRCNSENQVILGN